MSKSLFNLMDFSSCAARISAVLVITLLAATGCDNHTSRAHVARRVEIKEPAGANRDGSKRVGAAHQKQLEYLHRMQAADPHFKPVDHAVMNEQNEVGVVLNAYLALDSVPTVMRSILKQMAMEFPNQSLSVVAYAPSVPPTKLGTGRLDPQTHRTSFSWAIRVPSDDAISGKTLEI